MPSTVGLNHRNTALLVHGLFQGTAVAAIALVFIMPVLFKARGWYRFFGFLLVIIPLLMLLLALSWFSRML
jgi:hypothetical protein